MAVISKGQTFATGDQVSALKLNNLADNATFASGAVDNVSTQLSGGAIVVKDGGVTFAKLSDVNDDPTMATASATTLATSESIKAYVDSATNFTPSTYAGEESVTLPNGLIMKFGSKSVPGDYAANVSFATNFPGGIVQVQLTIETEITLTVDAGITATSQTVNGFIIQNGWGGTATVSWMAIGY
jgi:hypothetical protein